MLIALIATVCLTGTFTHFHPSIPHSVSAASFTLWGSISQGGWGFTQTSITSPGPTITVVAGASVSLNLYSADGAPHGFCVDYEQPNPNFVCEASEPKSSTFSSSTTPTILTFTATSTPGTYTYWCIVHGSSMRGSFVVTPPPPDFSMSSSPTSLTIQQGAWGTSTITLTSLNSFSGTVNMATNSSPPGVNPSLNQTSVTLSSGASHDLILNVTVPSAIPLGTYTVTVTGTSGSLSHSTTVPVAVVKPDFTITSGQNTMTIQPGKSGSSTITVTSTFGFSGSVALTSSTSTSSLTGTLNPTTTILSSGSATTSTLTVSVGNATALGNYQLIVNGTSGTLSHSITIMVTVSAPSQAGQIPISTIFEIGVVAIIVAVAIVGYVALRVRRKPL